MILKQCGCLIILLLVFQACSTTAPAPLVRPAVKDTQTLTAEIRARSQAFAAAEAARDVDASLAFWLPDAEMHNEGNPPFIGQAALRKMYEQLFPVLESLRAETARLQVYPECDLAYETGTLYQTFKFSSGPLQSTAKYLVVWKRGPKGKWQIAAGSVTGNPHSSEQ